MATVGLLGRWVEVGWWGVPRISVRRYAAHLGFAGPAAFVHDRVEMTSSGRGHLHPITHDGGWPVDDQACSWS